MEQWDQDYIDLIEPGYIELSRKYADGSNLPVLIKHKDIIEKEFFPC